VDKVKVIDLKPYFTNPSLYPSESQKFWKENQGVIADFVTGSGIPGSAFDIHRFTNKVGTALGHPAVYASEQSYLILGKPVDMASYEYINGRLQKAVYDHVLSNVDKEAIYIVVNIPKENLNEGRFYHERLRAQSDPWGHITNDMLAEVLNHFSVTQILPFPPTPGNMPIPNGLELVHLIQSRLSRSPMMSSHPHNRGPFNQFDPRFSGGYRPVPPIYGNGNAFFGGMGSMFNDFNAPQASQGGYARHAFTGVWTWYPQIGVYANIVLDHKGDDQKFTMQTLLNEIYKFVAHYGTEYEPHIARLVKEVMATLDNDPKALELLEGPSVTLFIGERAQIQPVVRERTNNVFTNWAMASGTWSPGKEYAPAMVINVIDDVAKYIPGYGNEGFGGRPGCW
jgi:hypothetical protein